MDWSAPGPLKAFRDRYAAPFAGVSYDLAPGALGVDPQFLENAPDLPGRRVLVTHEDLSGRDAVRRPSFAVVTLTRIMRDARRLASQGGLVFSSFDLDDPEAGAVLQGLEPGTTVFLNSAISRLPDVAVRRPTLS